MRRGALALAALGSACVSTPPVPVLSPSRTAAPSIVVVMYPNPPRGVVGDTIPMTAMLVGWSDHSVSCAPVWESLNPEVASFVRPGLLQVHRSGATTIRAMCESYVAATTGAFGP